MKKLLCFILVLLLSFTSIIFIYADDNPSQKEEVIYGLLNQDGSVNNLYVVNIFNGGEIIDYGSYSNIQNTTTAEKLNRSGDKITISTAAKRFYYQGTLDKKELPWNIAINYFLDGKEIPGKELAGKAGKLEIHISVKQNIKINNTFYDNYALQIGLSLDNKLCSNIKTNNATVAEAGSKKQLSYTVLPGDGIDIIVTADIHDFEMDAITINGIKLSLDINVDTSNFTKQISQLTEAIIKLDDGAGDLLSGLIQLSTGMQKYVDGIKAYKDGLGQLADGANKLDNGAAALKNGLLELSKQNTALINGALTIQQATFDSVNSKLSEAGLKLPVLTPENYSMVLSSSPDLADVKAQLDGALQFSQGLKAYADGVTQLSSGASALAYGTAEFKVSSAVLVSSANEIYTAGEELNMAIKKLHKGFKAYKNGTKELRNGTSDIDSDINEKIDEMLGGISGKGDKVISFVSEKNTNISAVQFVLKTDTIKPQKVSRTVTEKSEKLSFWQKLLKLFGLYK